MKKTFTRLQVSTTALVLLMSLGLSVANAQEWGGRHERGGEHDDVRVNNNGSHNGHEGTRAQSQALPQSTPAPQMTDRGNRGGGGRGGWNGGGQAQPAPQPAPQPQVSDRGNRGGNWGSNDGGERRGGWNQPAPQPAPQPQVSDRGNRGGHADSNDRHGEWNRGHDNRDGNRDGGWAENRNGDHDGGRRGGGDRENHEHRRGSYYNSREFEGYNGVRLGFYFAPHYGYYSVPQQYYGHRYRRGDYLPRFFYSYRVSDYDYYDLPYPPPGTAYFFGGQDIVLIDLYSGEILEIYTDIF